MKRIASAALAALVTGSVLAAMATPVAAAEPGAGFAGHWTTVDCAQTGDTIDCSVWGDGSPMTLGIGQGATPSAVFQDSFASVCANNGSAATRWVAAGSGEFDTDGFLWLTFTKSGCGAFGMGGYGGVQLYRDPGSDTLWEDEDGDGWGLVWHRVP